MTDLLFIAGNQLFPAEILSEHRDAVVLMVEDPMLCARLPFHQQKLAFVLAAMRNHAAALQGAGYRVRYFALEESMDVSQAIADLAAEVGATRLLHFETEDGGLTRTLEHVSATFGLRRHPLGNPMFLLDADTVDAYFDSSKSPHMASFYRCQRQRLNILVDEDCKPLGGQWSFDAVNRNRIPKAQSIPSLPVLEHDRNTRCAIEQVVARFPDHPGDAGGLWLPTDRAGALAWLESFLIERLTGFGTYEDAMTVRSPTTFHSVLSPLMNVGLLTPREVVSRALDVSEGVNVPLNDLEGFIRQVIGWREFVRGVYRRHRVSMRERNAWNAGRRLNDTWFDASTGLAPLDHALGTAIDYGWNHHIERLMVIANVMNLAEIHPDDAYRFFMTHYVDAYDWVMVPNVFGMGLTSDGGIFATKPYICGSNYIRKMSDHPRGDWADTLDGLYWRFVIKHRDVLARNPRLAVMTRGAERLDAQRLKRISASADAFLEANTR